MTRTEAIYALLASLFDYLPGPKTASYGDLPGPAPTTTATCKACSGAGHFGKKRRPCEACNATGQVAVDGYTGEAVGSKTTRTHAADPQRLDAELRRLHQNEEIRRGRLIDDPFRWEAERRRYRQNGSYAALERALESLRANEPDLCSLVMRHLVYREVPAGDAVAPHLERAVEWLSHHMPPEVRVPRWVGAPPPAVVREWPRDRRRTPAGQARNAEIIRLRGEGLAGAQIAREVGCSQATVSRVLAAVQLAGTAA